MLDITNLIIGQWLNPVFGSKRLASLRKVKIQKVRILLRVIRRQDNFFDMTREPVHVEGRIGGRSFKIQLNLKVYTTCLVP